MWEGGAGMSMAWTQQQELRTSIVVDFAGDSAQVARHNDATRADNVHRRPAREEKTGEHYVERDCERARDLNMANTATRMSGAQWEHPLHKDVCVFLLSSTIPCHFDSQTSRRCTYHELERITFFSPLPVSCS